MNHEFVETPGKRFYCAVCKQTWKHRPEAECPGLPVYHWGKWPKNYYTRNQLYDKGYKVGKQLPPPVAVVHRAKSSNGWMYLYEDKQALPRAKPTEAQIAAIEKAQEAAKLKRLCKRCGGQLYKNEIKRGICEACMHYDFLRRQRSEAIAIAKDLLNEDIVILDTETTGLNDAQIVELAIIDGEGKTLLNTRLKPQDPEKVHEVVNGMCAFDIHGIAANDLLHCPTFADIWPKLESTIENRTIVVYNYGYDIPIIRDEMMRYGIITDWHDERADFNGICAMKLYARYVGQWSDYHHSFRWQRLEGGDHSALGDCIATLDILKRMATTEEKTTS
jgi:DNA polymerase-3 subunit epsilon